MLELATAVEECTAILEEHREELKEVQRQSPDENGSPSSEAEFQMVQEKWLAFLKTSGLFAYIWHILEEKMEGPDDSDEPAIMPNNPMTPTMLKVSIVAALMRQAPTLLVLGDCIIKDQKYGGNNAHLSWFIIYTGGPSAVARFAVMLKVRN
ncbi:hypothetical protein Agabi119p4_8464 [Agaricus bisporus var. burnettii]|uniref:Uncharacterized protein n=1 Tax=Agaricus bisporus var. burnettii TaxID=192524 RepID=A0A8H7C753_AGABI|nr:hypothetical protein Agabi119p4_8464 [Agaricus bisporus var. burnettii]